MNVMPEAMLQRWQKVSIFRNYDPQTGNVYFWSDAFAIHELASAAADLAVKARAALSVDLQQPPNSVTYARTFTGGDVRISDLLNGEHQLSGFTFDSCRLIGPAVLITVEGGYYQDNEITDEMLWQIEREKSYLGSVGLVNCTIVRCSFVNVGWAKPPPGE
ncbi:hypothetical protein CVS47_02835 [Microbacterium lemovicicum]|uniref:Uncharacterized protein n=2 Tax=Microbacterium lemovicicum TaxID=1072463 RepID=A0A3Q9J1V7_9MICO|nr:hypothetical protein CVS47_02835 [Microbacterium lemovicicum]